MFWCISGETWAGRHPSGPSNFEVPFLKCLNRESPFGPSGVASRIAITPIDVAGDAAYNPHVVLPEHRNSSVEAPVNTSVEVLRDRCAFGELSCR